RHARPHGRRCYARRVTKLADMMTSDVLTVDPADTIGETAQRMVELGVSSAVVSDYGRLIGIVTERDLTRAVAGRVHSSEARVREWMTSDPITLTRDASPQQAARVVLGNCIRPIPAGADDPPRGLLSIRD